MAEVKNRTLVWESEKYARHQLSKLEGKKVLVEVSRVSGKRSDQQNRYYWLCMEIAGETLGYSKEELHLEFGGRFLPKKRIITQEITMSTSELSKLEFADYMELIIRECASMGIVLPNPDEYHKYIDSAPMK